MIKFLFKLTVFLAIILFVFAFGVSIGKSLPHTCEDCDICIKGDNYSLSDIQYYLNTLNESYNQIKPQFDSNQDESS